MEEDALEAGAAVERQPTPQFEPPPTAFGRRRKFPRRYEDFLPNTTTQLPHMPPKPMIAREPSPPASPSIHHVSPLHHHPTIIPQQSPQILINLVYFTSIQAIQLPFLTKICRWMTSVMHQVFLLVHNLLMAAGGLVLDVLNQIYQLPESRTMFLHHFSTPPFSDL